MPASPYATGGGGTVLEHRYGAVLLAHLLTGDPLPMMGDAVIPVSVRFQASAFSPVDDLLVMGRTPDGGQRRLSIGVRRAPALAGSDEASVHLLGSYLQVLVDHWQEVQAGRWRLGLAVASPNAAVQQIRELAVIARATPDEADFRVEVRRPGRTNEGVRNRLRHVDALVQAAAAEAGIGSDVPSGELAWRLLLGLHLAELRLEGADASDRTMAVGRLRTATRAGTAAAADALFSRLAELAGQYAPAGAEVMDPMLRRDLSGMPLARSMAYAQAWSLLDGLAARLHDRTSFRLVDPTGDLEVERAETREALVAEMTTAATGAGGLVVLGEPDVGKSALTIRAAEQMADAGVVVTILSLRDLPSTTVELEILLGGRLTDVLGGAATGSGRLLVIDGAESALEGRGFASFLGSMLGIVAVAAELGHRSGTVPFGDGDVAQATEGIGQMVGSHAELAQAEAAALQPPFFVLGSGPDLGTAWFGVAKFIEAAATVGVAQDLEEWAHEQYFTTGPDSTVFVHASNATVNERARRVASSVLKVGARLVTISAEPLGLPGEHNWPLPAITDPLRPLVSWVPMAMTAHAYAAAAGRSPFGIDLPNRMKTVDEDIYLEEPSRA
jgi:hypothetical protein